MNFNGINDCKGGYCITMRSGLTFQRFLTSNLESLLLEADELTINLIKIAFNLHENYLLSSLCNINSSLLFFRTRQIKQNTYLRSNPEGGDLF